MEWRDTGFVVAVRRHGESALIAELLTREHGRHLGLVRGGQSRKMRAVLQPGNEVAAAWRGRLSEHLGTISCELARAHAARFIDDPDRLAVLAVHCDDPFWRAAFADQHPGEMDADPIGHNAGIPFFDDDIDARPDDSEPDLFCHTLSPFVMDRSVDRTP